VGKSLGGGLARFYEDVPPHQNVLIISISAWRCFMIVFTRFQHSSVYLFERPSCMLFFKASHYLLYAKRFRLACSFPFQHRLGILITFTLSFNLRLGSEGEQKRRLFTSLGHSDWVFFWIGIWKQKFLFPTGKVTTGKGKETATGPTKVYEWCGNRTGFSQLKIL
jgi:hypothetical protein